MNIRIEACSSGSHSYHVEQSIAGNEILQVRNTKICNRTLSWWQNITALFESVLVESGAAFPLIAVLRFIKNNLDISQIDGSLAIS
jgi:hypothetical protein